MQVVYFEGKENTRRGVGEGDSEGKTASMGSAIKPGATVDKENLVSLGKLFESQYRTHTSKGSGEVRDLGYLYTVSSQPLVRAAPRGS